MTIALSRFYNPIQTCLDRMLIQPLRRGHAEDGQMMDTTRTDATTKGDWGRRLSWVALVLTAGGLAAALISAVGSGAGAWSFRIGFSILRYSFYAAMAGGSWRSSHSSSLAAAEPAPAGLI